MGQSKAYHNQCVIFDVSYRTPSLTKLKLYKSFFIQDLLHIIHKYFLLTVDLIVRLLFKYITEDSVTILTKFCALSDVLA